MLTPREIEVARMCSMGLTCKEIGKNLQLAPRTVEHHLEHARQKVGAKNIAHFIAILYAENILLHEEDPIEVKVENRLHA